MSEEAQKNNAEENDLSAIEGGRKFEEATKRKWLKEEFNRVPYKTAEEFFEKFKDQLKEADECLIKFPLLRTDYGRQVEDAHKLYDSFVKLLKSNSENVNLQRKETKAEIEAALPEQLEQKEKEAKKLEKEESKEKITALQKKEKEELEAVIGAIKPFSILEQVASDISKVAPDSHEFEEIAGIVKHGKEAQTEVKKAMEHLEQATGEEVKKAREDLDKAIAALHKVLSEAQKTLKTIWSKDYANTMPDALKVLKEELEHLDKKTIHLSEENKKILAKAAAGGGGGGNDGGKKIDSDHEEEGHNGDGGKHGKNKVDGEKDKDKHKDKHKEKHHDHGDHKHEHHHGFGSASFTPEKDPAAYIGKLGNSFSAMMLRQTAPTKFGPPVSHDAHGAHGAAHGHAPAAHGHDKAHPEKHDAGHGDDKKEKKDDKAKADPHKKEEGGKKEKAH